MARNLLVKASVPIIDICCQAEELLRGQTPSEELFAQAGQIASEDCSPSADGRGPVDYKRHLAGVLTVRALTRAADRATQEAPK
jgi:carbon-monoxide dehydrogenase medium subunit